MKYVVLRAVPPATSGRSDMWERVGAAEVELDDEDNLAGALVPERLMQAIEQAATTGGGYIAIPWPVWRVFHAEATVTVTPVQVGAPEPEPEVNALDRRPRRPSGDFKDPLDDPDMAGLQPGPRMPPP